MADARALDKAIAPFLRARGAQRAADARLSDLIGACAGDAHVRFERLNQLPAATQFTPFETLSIRGDADDTRTDNPRSQGAGARPRRAGGAPTQPGAGRQPPDPATMLSAYQPGVDDMRRERPIAEPGSPDKHLTTRVTALDPRLATDRLRADDPASASTRSTGRESSPRTASTAPANIARNAGELIGALLQRHAAPRQPARLQGIGARPTAAQALGGADDAAALQPTRLSAPPSATRPTRGQHANVSSAQPGPADDARAFAPREVLFETPSSQRLRAAQMRPETGAAMGERTPAALLQSGSETLRALVTPLFLRPGSGFDVAASATGSAAPRSADRMPVLRAPSRLLAGTTPGTGAAAPATGTQAATAAPAFAATAATLSVPALSVPALSTPANSAADLATGLEHLLREQAWLRGVDLT